MKICVLALLGASAVGQTLPAMAAGSNSLGTSAMVVGQCKVTTPPGVLNFGSVDPSGAANVTASTTLAMKCTKGTVSTAPTDNGGANFSGTKRMKHSATPTAFLPYAVVYGGATGFTGQGFGAAAGAQTITVTGTITPLQFQNALVTIAGQQYADTVTITVNP